MKPVLIIDFDDTLTAIPAFWNEVIASARLMGLRVICITQRVQDESNADEIDEWMADNRPGRVPIAVYFTNGRSKVDYIEQELQLTKYILCDDNPRRAVNGV